MVNVYRSYALGSLCVLEAFFSSTAATACIMPLESIRKPRGLVRYQGEEHNRECRESKVQRKLRERIGPVMRISVSTRPSLRQRWVVVS